LKSLGLKIPGLENSWLKSPGLKCPSTHYKYVDTNYFKAQLTEINS
jgi:hypothetical protein